MKTNKLLTLSLLGLSLGLVNSFNTTNNVSADEPATASITVINGYIATQTSSVFNVGDSCTIIAKTPAEGKKFAFWKNGLGGIEATTSTYTFTVTGDAIFTATFINDTNTDNGPDLLNGTNDKTDDKKGCSSSLVGGFFVLSIASIGLGYLLNKKKHN